MKTGELSFGKTSSDAYSSGVTSGSLLFVEPGNLLFGIQGGEIILEDENGKLKNYKWEDLHNLSTPHLNTSTSTYVFIGPALQVLLFPENPKPNINVFQNNIYIGRVIHSNLTNITGIISEIVPNNNPIKHLRDIFIALGAVNIHGNNYFPNNNLTLRKTEGASFKAGVNYRNDTGNPHFTNNLAVSVVNTRYRYKNGANVISTGILPEIDTTKYNPNDTLIDVPNGKWSIQDVYHVPYSNGTFFIYSKFIFDSQQSAINNINIDTNFDEDPILVDEGNLRARLLVIKGATNLSDPNQALLFKVKRSGLLAPLNVNESLTNVTSATSSALDSNYIHTQITPNNIWTVNHNLGKYPSVMVVDSGNNVVEGNINYTNLNQLTIEFNSNFGGLAYLN